MKVTENNTLETSVAARVAGEDIKVGDHVAILHETVEFPSYLWGASAISLEAEEAVRVRVLPQYPGRFYKVIGVCLPFVYAKGHEGGVIGFDTRQQQLVRIDSNMAREVLRELRSKKKKKK
ncbi:hypothetical protein [Aeoliella mucimassa]|uniref:Uncharacterized protein n=1 Tax=Aeoliella mucimassa TaxID=2527972 RepID=A0A518APW8_9BACT|nr:hypothetical protein [Aeoliella mucimassa]QDU56762.1 hypothetical protein Pan181_29740 [Aeoliella mucimassa]